MDFAVSCPLVRYGRLLFGFCPSTRTFVPCFLRTSPRGNSPCIITRPSPPSGRPEDFHLLVTEHAQHTTKPLSRRTLPRVCTSADREGERVQISWVTEKGGLHDPTSAKNAGRTPATSLRLSYRKHVRPDCPRLRSIFPPTTRQAGTGTHSPIPGISVSKQKVVTG